MERFRRFLLLISWLIVSFSSVHNCLAHSEPGPEADQHNTVYSYNISETYLDAHDQLHVTMNVHMCPYCNPNNNYVKVNISKVGSGSWQSGALYKRNLPVGRTVNRTFDVGVPGLEGGDTIEVSSDVWCSWCGHYYDRKTYRVERRVDASAGLGSDCETLTLVRIGSSVNIASGNLYDSFKISPDPDFPLALSYNSLSAQESRFGYGWNDSRDIRLKKQSNGNILLVDADGEESIYTPGENSSFISPAGSYDVLALDRLAVFEDDMENGPGRWNADAPWGLVTSGSNTHWTDSPNGNYANRVHKALALNLDLSGLERASLSFSHYYAIERSYDYGYIEVSSDGGANWTLLKSYTGFQSDWTTEIVSLDAYAGREDIRLRFRLITDGSITYDGWHIDDVVIDGGAGYQLLRKSGDTVFFSDEGRPAAIIDRNGNMVQYQYSGDELTALTDSDGRALFFEYAGDRVTSIEDAVGRAVSFEYGLAGDLVQIANAVGEAWRFSYDTNRNLIRKTSPLGQVTTYTFDEKGRLISASDSEGNRNVDYYEDGLTRVTDAAGNPTDYGYNDSLRLTEKIDAEGNITTYIWDQNLNKTSVSDASGTVRFTYDEEGNVLSRTDQEGNVTAYTYDEAGNLLTTTGPDGAVTANEYDARGNLIVITDPNGNTTRYVYDDKGRLTTLIDAAGGGTTYTYDAAGNLIKITDPGGKSVSMVYDAAGNMLSRTDAVGNTTRFDYDLLNRLVAVTNAEGHTTRYEYDVLGNLLAKTDANGHTTRMEYDAWGRLVKIIDALGQATALTYDEPGCAACGAGGDKPASLTDAQGNATSFDYDALGRLITEIDPLGNRTQYGYDSMGNMISRTDAYGNTIKYTYDRRGRLLEKRYPDGTAVTFAYDSVGRLIAASNEYIAYKMNYDSTGRLLSIADNKDRTISYRYNALGNRMKLITPEGREVDYIYDEENNLARMASWAGVFELSSNALGQRETLSYPNGLKATYGYDSSGNFAEISVRHEGGGDIVAAFTYTHDFVGNRLTRTALNHQGHRNRLEYAYDPVYRLLESLPVKLQGNAKPQPNTAEVFAYDPVGNRLAGPRTKATYVHNEANQLLEGPKYSYRYDKNGNLTGKIGLDEKGEYASWSYEYDFESSLIRATKMNAEETKVVSFKYDPFGRRIEKRVEDLEGGDVRTYAYVYDNEDIILELLTKAEGRKERIEITRYLHGPSIDEPLAIEQKGNLYYYHADGLGSITSLTDVKGSVVQSWEYTSFGIPKHHGNHVKQPYGFTGREWDAETDLYFYRARYYDPQTGRFISEDPAGFGAGDVNLYAYVQNNPVNLADPSGLSAGASPCDGYKSCFNSKCCRDDVWVKDSYPETAYTVCKGFMVKYDNNTKVKCVATCLISEERQVQDDYWECSKRNSARLRAHMKCYASCRFVPSEGLPEGGPEVGWEMLWPDFWRNPLSLW